MRKEKTNKILVILFITDIIAISIMIYKIMQITAILYHV